MLALLCAVSLISTTYAQDDLQAKTVYATQKDSVYKVEAKFHGEWLHIGSGFIVKYGTRYYAVTARHVAQAQGQVLKDGKPVEEPFDAFRLNLDGKIITVSFASMKNQDIAACRVNPVEKYATIAFSQPEIGDKVYAIGYPADQSKVLSEGIVNQFIKFSNSQEMIGFSSPIWYGNSGGILLSERAEVVGVTVAKYWEPAPHLFYAEKCGGDFKNFLKNL